MRIAVDFRRSDRADSVNLSEQVLLNNWQAKSVAEVSIQSLQSTNFSVSLWITLPGKGKIASIAASLRAWAITPTKNLERAPSRPLPN